MCGEYFERFETHMEQALKQRRVKVKLIGSKDHQTLFGAFEVDLDCYFPLICYQFSFRLLRRKK